MAELDNEFKLFLASYKYYPDLTDDFRYNSLPEDKRDALIALAKSEYGEKFEKWKKVPPEIILAHPEGVPQWILDVTNEADSARLLVLKENTDIRTREELEEKVKEVEEENRRQQMTPEEREIVDKANYEKERGAFEEKFEKIAETAVVIALIDAIKDAGYAPVIAKDLAKERLFRDDLFKQAGGVHLSGKNQGILRQSRLKTFDLIKKDWETRRPERALIHELSRFNRGEISEAKAADKIKELVTLIRDKERFDELDRYLRHPLVRAKVRHFDPEKIEMLSAVDRILFDEKHNKPEVTKEQKLAKNFEERDLPEDVRTVLGKVKAVQEKTAERQHLFERPRVRLKINARQNTQS